MINERYQIIRLIGGGRHHSTMKMNPELFHLFIKMNPELFHLLIKIIRQNVTVINTSFSLKKSYSSCQVLLHVGQNASSTRLNIYPLISCKYLFKNFKLLNLKDINLLPTISFLLWNTESKSVCSPFSCSFHPKEWEPSVKCLNTQFLSLKLNK